jgi:hypothetical protein
MSVDLSKQEEFLHNLKQNIDTDNESKEKIQVDIDKL